LPENLPVEGRVIIPKAVQEVTRTCGARSGAKSQSNLSVIQRNWGEMRIAPEWFHIFERFTTATALPESRRKWLSPRSPASCSFTSIPV